MRQLVNLFVKTAKPDHRAVFHDFAERLARMLARSRPRVRAVER